MKCVGQYVIMRFLGSLYPYRKDHLATCHYIPPSFDSHILQFDSFVLGILSVKVGATSHGPRFLLEKIRAFELWLLTSFGAWMNLPGKSMLWG